MKPNREDGQEEGHTHTHTRWEWRETEAGELRSILIAESMSQTDTNNDSDTSLQVCDCGWSKVTTYNELKIHQTETGCKPKGVKVDESKQDLKLDVYTPLNTDMASARPSPSKTVSMETHLKCSICMSLFVDPVTTACGHSFCKECLDRNCEYNDRLCPLCKQILRRTPEVNIVLRSIAEQVKKTQEEDAKEEVVPIEDEWVKKKATLKNTKIELQEKIVKRKSWVDETNASLQSCKDQLENEWWDIENVFTAVIAIVEEAHAAAHKPVQDRREVVEKEAKDIQLKLEAEINRLEKTISELDNIAALDDHILFLQSYPSLQDPNNLKDSTEVELDTSLSFGTMRKTTTTMLEQIQQKLENLTSIELQRVPKFTVDVKLDPTTAHRRLILSDDGKEVKDEGEDQEVDDAPERKQTKVSL
ncbi:hypothetical protein PFLUV_G00167600 [Perca fluviatilis]|uniref:RING-type domain-containing protein n=1 Tax=Perca fluviatilis TaxID=8168 RepID=A0A6A5EDZ5_PERFL|nr:hypothetical protein PFLUV_G00167600 [Perca fluviatilis]